MEPIWANLDRVNYRGFSNPQHAWTPPATAELISYASFALPGEAANAFDQYEQVTKGAQQLSLGYDERGNLNDVLGGAEDRVYTFTLDNRMDTATVGAVSIAYDYDVQGRRVGKDVDGQVTRFLYSEDMEIAKYDGAGALLRRYIPGGAIDARVAWVDVAANGTETLEYYHADRQEVGRHKNNRAEISHLPCRRRERVMSRFRRMSNLQKFVSTHASLYNHFNLDRHLNRRQIFKTQRDGALLEWRELLVA